MAGTGQTVFGGSALTTAEDGNDEEDEDQSIDVFLVAGQSNACGRGDSSKSPDILGGYAYEYTGSGLEDVDDPVGESFQRTEAATTGSAWPAFADEWHRYGRKSVLVPVAYGNTAQVAAADVGAGNWDSSGTLRYTARDATTDAKAWLEDNGYDPTLRGAIWIQGERDATEIDKGTITKEDYENGLKDMIRFFRDEIQDEMPFYINQTGVPADGDTDGYEDVRNAQSDIAAEQWSTYLATDFAKDFPSSGLMSDRLHYTQDGYDTIGRYSAWAVHVTQF